MYKNGESNIVLPTSEFLRFHGEFIEAEGLSQDKFY